MPLNELGQQLLYIYQLQYARWSDLPDVVQTDAWVGWVDWENAWERYAGRYDNALLLEDLSFPNELPWSGDNEYNAAPAYSEELISNVVRKTEEQSSEVLTQTEGILPKNTEFPRKPMSGGSGSLQEMPRLGSDLSDRDSRTEVSRSDPGTHEKSAPSSFEISNTQYASPKNIFTDDSPSPVNSVGEPGTHTRWIRQGGIADFAHNLDGMGREKERRESETPESSPRINVPPQAYSYAPQSVPPGRLPNLLSPKWRSSAVSPPGSISRILRPPASPIPVPKHLRKQPPHLSAKSRSAHAPGVEPTAATLSADPVTAHQERTQEVADTSQNRFFPQNEATGPSSAAPQRSEDNFGAPSPFDPFSTDTPDPIELLTDHLRREFRRFYGE